MSENTEINQAVKVSKTSVNYAQKRGLKVVIDEKNKAVYLHHNKKKKEWACCYSIERRGLFFKSSHLNFTIKQELPYWVTSDKHFREVIEFIATELKN